MSVIQRNNVKLRGRGTQPMLFAHGFGCDQNMWRFVAPAFDDDYRVVLFDHVGSGQSDLRAYHREKYARLDGYAGDVLEICRELALDNVVFVGHSVAAMIGVRAALKEPQRFSRLVLIGPSPCYLNEGDYRGGFSIEELEGLLEFMDANYLGWSRAMAPKIVGNPERSELAEELTNSFCRTDPDIAKDFARVTFLSDNRADLAKLGVPSLVLQCSQDIIAGKQVGEYVHRQLRGSRIVYMRATGHCPNLSAPQETIDAMKAFLQPALA
ncbi:MAG: alpha/beta fold hydrolase [Burkholderiales bacterium]